MKRIQKEIINNYEWTNEIWPPLLLLYHIIGC